jgi:hypothetical protein
MRERYGHRIIDGTKESWNRYEVTLGTSAGNSRHPFGWRPLLSRIDVDMAHACFNPRPSVT